MVCLTCHRPTPGALCADCGRGLKPATDRILPGGLPVLAAFSHTGVGRRLVHLLKYGGVVAAADLIAQALDGRLPPYPLVPIPRAMTRRLRYGVDPARELALSISRSTGGVVVAALGAPVHSRRRAGRNRRRPVAPYRLLRQMAGPLIVVDDVITSGATLVSAVDALGPDRVAMVVCATSTAGVSSLRGRVTIQPARNR